MNYVDIAFDEAVRTIITFDRKLSMYIPVILTSTQSHELIHRLNHCIKLKKYKGRYVRCQQSNECVYLEFQLLQYIEYVESEDKYIILDTLSSPDIVITAIEELCIRHQKKVSIELTCNLNAKQLLQIRTRLISSSVLMMFDNIYDSFYMIREYKQDQVYRLCFTS